VVKWAQGGGEIMNFAKIESAAKHAMDKHRKMTGKKDIDADIAKAISAAIEEYDKQKSEES